MRDKPLVAIATTGVLNMTAETHGPSNTGGWSRGICKLRPHKATEASIGHTSPLCVSLKIKLRKRARANQAVETSIVHTSPQRKRTGQHRLQNPSAHSRRKYWKFVQETPERVELSPYCDADHALREVLINNKNSTTGNDARAFTAEPMTRGIQRL